MTWTDWAKIVGPIVAAGTAVYGFILKRKESRTQAATKFRESVLNELQGLYPLPVEWPETPGIDHRLKKSFPRLQAVVAAYRPFVKNKTAFDFAWLKYRNAYQLPQDDQCYHHYMDFTSTKSTLDGPVTEATNGKANFKQNVDSLLSFAPGA
jgi:hypothetical protein